MARVRCLLVTFVALALSVSCGRDTSHAPHNETAKLQTWQESLQLGELRPMADGGAYLVGSSGIFHLSNGTLTPVHGLPAHETFAAADVTALADGSAVLTLPFHEPPLAFWLKRDQAHVIEESDAPPSASTQQVDAKGFYFAEAARLKRDIDSGDACSDVDNKEDDRPEPDYDD
jgi:hypothetical protein